MFAILPHMVWP